jgi:tetratricopeptide (TPR) repeat protein
MRSLLLALIAALATPKEALWYRVDRNSLRQLVAYGILEPDSKAYGEVARLLGDAPQGTVELVAPLIPWLTGPQAREGLGLKAEQRAAMKPWTAQLANRRLQGFGIKTVAELRKLEIDQVDLARGLLLEQWGTSEEALERIEAYEAQLDWMALEVLSRVGERRDGPDLVSAINELLFDQMHIRFPPHRLAESAIDSFTALPLVVDSRRGVCLGVSCLYLCLAQRLDLPLEIVTPPGHIVLRYRHGDRLIGIETTAGGIDLPEEVYLSVNTRKLHLRSIKEVVGLALCNEAAARWGQGDLRAAADLYRRAEAYMPQDPFVAQFLGASLMSLGEKREGRHWLQVALDNPDEDQIHPIPLAADLLSGATDGEAVAAVFKPSDATVASVEAHRQDLEKTVKRCPRFRAGWMSLALCYLELHQPKRAIEALERLKKLDPEDPMVAYYLAMLSTQRHDLPKAWQELERAEAITARHDYSPKNLRRLRAELQQLSPRLSIHTTLS